MGEYVVARRVWAMPSKFTFRISQIAEFCKKYIKGKVIDPFAGGCSILDIDKNAITNDINFKMPSIYHEDASVFMERFDASAFNTVIFDPPYSVRQLKECYDGCGMKLTMEMTRADTWARWKDLAARLVIPGGISLSFGWNSCGLGINRGFRIIEILIVCHGGMHNDTICVAEMKQRDMRLF